MSRKDFLNQQYGADAESRDKSFAATESRERTLAALNNPNRIKAKPIADVAIGIKIHNDTVDDLKRQLAEGDRVVELDPSIIQQSEIADRFDVAADLDELIESIAETGQQVPILVRPHPTRPLHYQIVYGRRRLLALSRLGKPVKAIVRNLSDKEAYIAQGRENNARLDTTYIEKAHYAHSLEQAGVSREEIGAILGMDKGSLSKLINTAKALPLDLAKAIGKAPSAGRKRWEELIKALEAPTAMSMVREFLSDYKVQQLTSDERFERVVAFVRSLSELAKPTAAPKPVFAFKETDKAVTLTIDKSTEPEFGTYLKEQLPALYEQFKGGKA